MFETTSDQDYDQQWGGADRLAELEARAPKAPRCDGLTQAGWPCRRLATVLFPATSFTAPNRLCDKHAAEFRAEAAAFGWMNR